MSANNAHTQYEQPASYLELSIWWGREHLCRADSAETVALEQAFRQKENVTDATLDALLTEFESRVELALKELGNDLTLELGPDEAREAGYGLRTQDEAGVEEESEPDFYASITRYLQTLDDVVFLSHAVQYFPPLQYRTTLQERVLDLVDRVITDCPPAYRLIPMNPMRRSALEGLPENVHDLFPWYTKWSEVPDDALTLLADHLAGNPVPEMPVSDLQALWMEMETDEPLRAQIIDYATTLKNLPAAIQQAYAYRWLLEAKEAETEGEMPDAVVKAGIVSSAIRVAVESILSGVLPFEWRFRAGFCGLGLTDEQRFEVLKPIELIIKEAGGATWDGSSHLIQQWLENKLPDQALGEAVFKGWIHDLQEAAGKPFIPLFAEETIYWLLLRMDDPMPLARAIHSLDEACTIEPLRNLGRELLTAKGLEAIPAGFLSLAAHLADATTTLDAAGITLYDQWMASLKLREKPHSTLRSFVKELSGQVGTVWQYAPDSLRSALQSLPVYFLDKKPSKSLSRQQTKINPAPAREEGLFPGMTSAIVSFLQGGVPTLPAYADSSKIQTQVTPQKTIVWAKIANVADGTIRDMYYVMVEGVPPPVVQNNEMFIMGGFPSWLDLPEKVQWFCDWLFPDGSIMQPTVLEIEGHFFKAIFEFKDDKRAAAGTPEGEFRVLILVQNLRLYED